ALAVMRRALTLQPQSASVHYSLGNVLKELGLIEQAVTVYRQAVELAPDARPHLTNLLFALQYHPDYDSCAIGREHGVFNSRFAEPLRPAAPVYVNVRDPNRRLRIGYVSPDFREHPVGRCMQTVLAHHDPHEVELFAY